LAIVHLALNSPKLVGFIKVKVLINIIGKLSRIFAIFFISLRGSIRKFILLLLELIHLFFAIWELPDLIFRAAHRIRLGMSR
jgi:hypothetical protein